MERTHPLPRAQWQADSIGKRPGHSPGLFDSWLWHRRSDGGSTLSHRFPHHRSGRNGRNQILIPPLADHRLTGSPTSREGSAWARHARSGRQLVQFESAVRPASRLTSRIDRSIGIDAGAWRSNSPFSPESRFSAQLGCAPKPAFARSAFS